MNSAGSVTANYATLINENEEFRGMSDKAFVAVIVMSVAIIMGFMANCEKDRQRGLNEIEKAKVEHGIKP